MTRNLASELVALKTSKFKQDPARLDLPRLAALLHQSREEAMRLERHIQQVRLQVIGPNHYCHQSVFDHFSKQLGARVDHFTAQENLLKGLWKCPPDLTEGESSLEKNHMDSLGSILEYPLGSDRKDQIDSLVDHFGEFTEWGRIPVLTAKRLGHQELSDFYIGVGRAMEKFHWMLTALSLAPLRIERG